MSIYLSIVSLWAIGIHIYGVVFCNKWEGFSTGKKIIRGVAGFLFQSVLAPLTIPYLIWRLVAKKPWHLTMFYFGDAPISN